MKKVNRILALALITILAFMSLAGCSGNTEPQADNSSPSQKAEASSTEENTDSTESSGYQRKTEAGTLTIGTTEATGTFDRTSTDGNLISMHLVYDSLFEINPDTQEVEPLLVDTYEYIDDTTLEITLKDGVYFSNGEQLTAEDVLYSMERYIITSSRRNSYYLAYDFENSFIDPENSLKFTLKYIYPYGPGISYLIDPIYCKAWAEAAPESDWFNKPVGSGPYTCVENVSGTHTKFELKDDYWGDDTSNMAKSVTVKYYTEQSTLYIDYCNGAIDAAFDIGSSDMERLMAGEEGHSVYSVYPKNDVYMVILPEYVDVFDDINVRKAVAHAIDMDGVIEVAFGSLGIECQSTLPATVNYSIDTGGVHDYNPELAKQLLAEAGYSDGDINLRVVCTNDTRTVRIGETVQAYLADVGINMSLESYDLATAVGMMIDGETDICFKNAMEGAPSKDPDQVWDTLGENSTFTPGRQTNEEFNSYVNTALRSIDPEVRAGAYAKAQEFLRDDYRVLPICEAGYGYVYRDYISSFNVVAPSTPNLRYACFAD